MLAALFGGASNCGDKDRDKDKDDKNKGKDKGKGRDMDRNKNKDMDRNKNKDMDRDMDGDRGRLMSAELLLPDGSRELHLGELVRTTPTEIHLRRCRWVAETGRRHLFEAGTPDETVEIEAWPDDVVRRFPRWGTILSDWPHPLPDTM